MADVFFAYSRRDNGLILHLVKRLRDREIDVFWDKRIRVGEDWRERLRGELLKARIMIVIWTENSIASGEVRKELEEFIGQRDFKAYRKKLLMYRLHEGLEAPSIVGHIQVAPYPGEDGIVGDASDVLAKLAARTTFLGIPLGKGTPPTAPAEPLRVNLGSDWRPSTQPETRSDGGTNYRALEPAHLHPISVVAQCLDNQWVPTSLLAWQRNEALSLRDPAMRSERVPAIRREFLRSLISTQQIVVNRAFLFSNQALIELYDEVEPFTRLLSDGAIVPYLFNENSPIERPKFETRAFAQWERIARGADLNCVKLHWGSANADKTTNMSRTFASYMLSLGLLNSEIFASELGFEANPEELAAFRSRIRELAQFCQNWEGEAPVARNDLYKAFITPDGDDPSEGRIAPNKPFALLLKQIIDLKYNVNLPDALGRASMAPTDGMRRRGLQELQALTIAGDVRLIEPDYILQIIKDINFNEVVQSIFPVNFDDVTLSDVIATRSSLPFQAYIDQITATLPKLGAPSAFEADPRVVIEDTINAYKNVGDDLAARVRARTHDRPLNFALEVYVHDADFQIELVRDGYVGRPLIRQHGTLADLEQKNSNMSLELKIMTGGNFDFRHKLAQVKVEFGREFMTELSALLAGVVDRGKFEGSGPVDRRSNCNSVRLPGIDQRS